MGTQAEDRMFFDETLLKSREDQEIPATMPYPEYGESVPASLVELVE